MNRIWALAALAMVARASQASTTYYVSVTGKDTNVGTASAPWRTIQHACEKIAAGDKVLVATGVYHEEVKILKSMTLASAPSAKPVIDGSDLPVPQSDAGLVLINGVGDVVVEGFEIRNYKTTNSELTPSGILVEGTENNVTIKGNLVHDIANLGTVNADINAFGIAVYGNSPKGAITHLTIDSNEVRNTKTGNSETVTLNGNVDAFTVTNNLIHDVDNIGIDMIGFEGTSPIKGQDQARNGTVAQNTVYNVTTAHNPAYNDDECAGIYVDGGANIVIERNVVHNDDLGIEVTSEHFGHTAQNVIVRSNLAYYNNVVGLSIGGYAENRGGTLDCTFVNNTFYRDDLTNSGSGELMIQFHTKGNIFKNNILSASYQGVLISEDAGAGVPGLVSDYNLFYAPANEDWNWGTGDYSDLASFAHASGGDHHSLFAAAEFVNPSKFDFHILPHSPAMNKGVDLGTAIEGALDLAGNPRILGSTIDLGCYEDEPAGP